MRTISATELARNLRRMLDDVEHRGDEITVVRNNRQIARIIPGAQRQTALEALGNLYRTLDDRAAASWVRDSRKGSRTLKRDLRDPWR
jgi:prevent-host-death family protein